MASFGDDSADFASGYSDILAPALTAQFAAGVTGMSALTGAMAAAGPLAIVAGVFKAIAGRRKRKRRRRRARRRLAAQRVTARGQAREVGVQGQQALGQVTASGTQFGGTLAAGMSQAVMGSVFLQQQRIMQGVGLSVKSMAKARDKALRRERLRKARSSRWGGKADPENPVFKAHKKAWDEARNK